MNSQKTQQNTLEVIKVDLKLKLALMWASFMFLVIYLDYFHLYMPSSLENMLAGKVFVFDVTQGFLLAALTMVSIPAMMISLSVAMPVKINRWLNIIIASINIPLILFNLTGVAWIHMIIGALLQIVLLCLIIIYAWKWPRIEK